MATARSRRRLLALLAAPLLLAGCNWLQWGGNQIHTNVSPEQGITPANAGQLHQLWQVRLPAGAPVAGSPAYVEGIQTSAGTKDLLVVTGTYGDVYALDAATGATVWHVAPPSPSCQTQVPGVCFTSESPAIDLDAGTVFSYSPNEGVVHQYHLANGSEVTGGGWPEVVTLKPQLDYGSATLTIGTFGSTSYLYVTTSGYGQDLGDYQGHVTAINLANGSQRVFNALCSDQTVHFVAAPGSPDCPDTRAGVWARPGVIADADTGKVYFSTGNAPFDPTGHDWGDSVLALHPDGTGSGNGNPVDSYTPANYAELQDKDLDLGSTEPTVLPAVPGARYPHLGVQGGKDGLLRFLNLDDLSGQGGPGHIGGEVPWSPTRLPQGDNLLSQPLAWTDSQGQVWLFVATRYDLSYQPGTGGLTAFRVLVDPYGNPYLSTAWTLRGAPAARQPGVVTSTGVLFLAADNFSSSGYVAAFNAHTGSGLWLAGLPGDIHWQAPVVGGGRVFVADNSDHVTAFGP